MIPHKPEVHPHESFLEHLPFIIHLSKNIPWYHSYDIPTIGHLPKIAVNRIMVAKPPTPCHCWWGAVSKVWMSKPQKATDCSTNITMMTIRMNDEWWWWWWRRWWRWWRWYRLLKYQSYMIDDFENVLSFRQFSRHQDLACCVCRPRNSQRSNNFLKHNAVRCCRCWMGAFWMFW